MAKMIARASAKLANSVRLARARHKHKTVRFKVQDLGAFYEALNKAGVSYVILRWLEDVPLHTNDHDRHDHDIDHLIGRGCIDQIKSIASDNPGLAKCDFYSTTGERGSAYRGMPYLPPALAEDVLAQRELRDDNLFAPCTQHMFLAFAYHLVYHKGTESGIDTGFDHVPTDAKPKRDYGAELTRLAEICGIKLPTPLSLLGIHEFLVGHRWNMPLDLMTRWPNAHDVIKALSDHEEKKLQPLLDYCADLNVFVLRSDCVGDDNVALASKMIAERFTILDTLKLDMEQVETLTRLTRGGNWLEKTQTDPILPTHMFVCQQAETPGPLPQDMSAEKLKKRYPHLAHTDVLIKRDIRDAVNAALGGRPTRIIIHATDNPKEAAETISVLKNVNAQSYLEALRSST